MTPCSSRSGLGARDHGVLHGPLMCAHCLGKLLGAHWPGEVQNPSPAWRGRSMVLTGYRAAPGTGVHPRSVTGTGGTGATGLRLLGSHPSSHIPGLARKPLTPSWPPPPPWDCERQHTPRLICSDKSTRWDRPGGGQQAGGGQDPPLPGAQPPPLLPSSGSWGP